MISSSLDHDLNFTRNTATIVLGFIFVYILGLITPFLFFITKQSQHYSTFEFPSRASRSLQKQPVAGIPLSGPTRRNFFRTSKNLYIHYNHYTPTSSTTRNHIIILIHGLGEHSERYLHVIDELVNKRHFICFALDLEGHGRSEGDRMFIESFDDYIESVIFLSNIAKQTYPKNDQSIMGHSMGGLIVARCLQLHPHRFVASVLSGPALDVNCSQLERRLAPLISLLFPHLPMNRSSPLLLSHDKFVVDFYCNDPLCSTAGVSSRLGWEILKNVQLAKQSSVKIDNLLLIRGKEDSICPKQGIYEFYLQSQSKNKSFVELKGLFHEIYNEPGGEAVKEVCDWFEACLI